MQYEDFGHNKSDGHFWQQMDFLIPELLRVLKPGRIAAIHVRDRILYGHQTPSGVMEVSPFRMSVLRLFASTAGSMKGGARLPRMWCARTTRPIDSPTRR